MAKNYAWEQNWGAGKPRFLIDYEYEAFRDLVTGWGFKEAGAREVFAGLVRKGYTSVEQMNTHRVSPALLARLSADDAPPIRVFENIETHASVDGSTKYVYHLHDGGVVESVYMPFEGRDTLCISSQAGCALGCTFCATGAMGFKRHLSVGEILGQVIHMRRRHGGPQTERMNVVFMGMGEPLHNLEHVLGAFRSMTHGHGMCLSDNDVAVSTSGLVPRIRQMAEEHRRPRLMVSIAATTDVARSAIMPVNRAYPLEELLSTLEQFPLRKKERIMLSYVLIAGQNDSPDDARRLAAMSLRFPSLVNLIPMNEHPDSPGMSEPEEQQLIHFANMLKDLGAFTTIRRSRGRDVAAACGQLAARVV